VVGGANPQAGFGFLVQLPNCECGHASNDSIASIGCKEAHGLTGALALRNVGAPGQL